MSKDMREACKLVLLLVALLCMFWLVGSYIYDYYKQCDGAVVRGLFGLACVAGG